MKKLLKRAKRFVQRHAPKFQVAITVVGTGVTIATVVGLVAAGQIALAAALSTWAVVCAVIALTVSAQAEGMVAV